MVTFKQRPEGDKQSSPDVRGKSISDRAKTMCKTPEERINCRVPEKQHGFRGSRRPVGQRKSNRR